MSPPTRLQVVLRDGRLQTSFVGRSERLVLVRFRDLPITAEELYLRLKAKGVLIIPGHLFFPGLEGEWAHRHECIRVSYGSLTDDETLRRGMRAVAQEAAGAFSE